MAKVTGPLHSIAARGRFAAALIFQRGSSGQVAKRHHRGNQAPTAARIAQQARYRAAVADWRALDQAGRDAYAADAARYRLTTYQAFMRLALASPAAQAGSTWDAGASIWDAGASIWDL